jgi:two-component system cell cycle sensor histidine kinase/response regulator CckA
LTKELYIRSRIHEQLTKFAPVLCLGGALIFLLLSALDYVSTPENFRTFLSYRVAISSYLLFIFLILHKRKYQDPLVYQLLILTAVFGSACTIEMMIIKTGGHTSTYYVGMALVGIWVISFLPVRFTFSLMVSLVIYGVYLVPIVTTERIVDFKTFYGANVFLVALLSSSLVLRYFYFRGMVRELEVKYDLEAYQVQLEQLVGDRTAQLSESIINLQKEVGERKKAEKEIKNAADEWLTTFDSTKDVIMLLSMDLKVVRANKAATIFCGKSFADIIGKRFDEMILCSETTPGADPASLSLRSHTHEEQEIYLPTMGKWTLISADPVLTRSGTINGAVVIIKDVTAMKKITEERETLEAQFRQSQKMQAVGHLAGGVAHDFNNILTAIIGYGNLLRLKIPPENPLRNFVDQILTTTDKAASLTQSLLAFSRKQVMSVMPLDINEIVRGMKKILDRIIGEDIVFKVRTSDRDLIVMCDKGQIEHVLINLATNARDAMPQGGNMTISTEEAEIDETFIKSHGLGAAPGDYAVISIADTGVGMDESTQQQIFEPFFTSKEVGKGTGLGLAMVYGTINQHNGFITVSSELGKGSVFKAYLPLAQVKGDVLEQKSPDLLYSGKEGILLVEDDAAVRHATKTLLEGLGYSVIEAANGEYAIKLFREHADKIQLVISDMIMPGISVKDVLAGLGKIKADVKVLFISGYAADVLEAKGIKRESINFISKPLRPAAFSKKIREVLAGADLPPVQKGMITTNPA